MVLELLVRQEALRIELEEALFCKRELAAPDGKSKSRKCISQSSAVGEGEAELR